MSVMAGTQCDFRGWIAALVGLAMALGVFVPTATPAAAASPEWLPPTTVSLVGDSLTAANVALYDAGLKGQGVRVSAISGVVSRALRHGWQCTVGGRMRLYPRPVNSGCRREGLEELEYFRSAGRLGDAVVLALGTNDGLLYRATAVRRAHLSEVRTIIGNRPVYLVSVTAGRADFARVLATYDTDAATWCAADVACRVIDWAASTAARQPASYVRDGVHLQPLATAARAGLIARDVVRLATGRAPAPAPVAVAAGGADHQLTVTWTPSIAGRAQAVDRWVVVTHPGDRGCVAAAGARRCTVSGVPNGVALTVSVRAGWRTQLGAASRSVVAVPRSLPSGPSDVDLAVTVDGAVEGSWQLDADDGGFPILVYYVTMVDAATGTTVRNATASATELKHRWFGLPPGQYRLSVSSGTVVGQSAWMTSATVSLLAPAAQE
jgi:lysophospholipase L1-like esterase